MSSSTTATKSDDLLKVRIIIGERDYKQDLEVEAQAPVDLEGLNNALSGHPGRFAWWAMLEALARAQHDELETQQKRLEAELYAEHGAPDSALAKKLGKAPTVDAIKSAVLLDKRLHAHQDRIAKAKLALEQVTVGRQTMQQRKDALLAIGSNMRAEMEARMFQIRDRSNTTYPPGSRAPGALPEPGRAAPVKTKNSR